MAAAFVAMVALVQGQDPDLVPACELAHKRVEGEAYSVV